MTSNFKMPFLPGHSFHDPEKTTHHKVQMFGVKGGGHMTECRFKTCFKSASRLRSSLSNGVIVRVIGFWTHLAFRRTPVIPLEGASNLLRRPLAAPS